MQEIPNTFCPAKWDEVFINLQNNLIYACCKSTPVPIDRNLDKVLNHQKENLLAGIRDSSCEYCWKLEKNNLPSLRHEWLNKYTAYRKYQDYSANTKPLQVEINLGNECNFQCIYCNPKFSSKWHADIDKKPYKIFSDRSNYVIPIKVNRMQEEIKQLVKKYSTEVNSISFIGGEPFYNKSFFQILDLVSTEEITVTTNLSSDISTIEKFFKSAGKFKKVKFNISVDSTNKIAEFTRYGTDFKRFKSNLLYVIENAPENLQIKFLTLLTSITIRDLSNLKNMIMPLLDNNYIKWELSYCSTPKFQSLDTLKDELKEPACEILSQLVTNEKIMGAATAKSAVLSSKFNNTLYMQLVHFINEFADRKKIDIPFDLN